MNWSRLIATTREGPADTSPGDRTEFDDSPGRVVFSPPGPPPQDKTPVFPLEAHDSGRPRLTHSLEVSSVARDLSQAACRRLADRIPPEYCHAVSTIAAACALLHDVGN